MFQIPTCRFGQIGIIKQAMLYNVVNDFWNKVRQSLIHLNSVNDAIRARYGYFGEG